jgi:hypothetical protein
MKVLALVALVPVLAFSVAEGQEDRAKTGIPHPSNELPPARAPRQANEIRRDNPRLMWLGAWPFLLAARP